MTASERRLAKIEAALSPKEAVLTWMAEAHAHGSLFAYVQSLQGRSSEAYPLVRLGQQMETAVRGALRGRREQEVWPAVRLAVRDASFLYYLSSNLNHHVLEHKRANWLHMALVAEMLRSAVEREAKQQLAHWWGQARQAADTAYVQQGAVEAAAGRYFDGVTPLFPDVAGVVAEQVQEIERVIGIFNELMVTLAPRRKRKRTQDAQPSLEPMDLVQVRLEAEPAIRAELTYLVDISKAEALRLIGEDEEGHKLVGRHVWKDAL